MSWQGIEGHDDVVEQFRRVLARRRLASTFLFVGPPGVGKHTFAEKLAQGLLCQAHGPDELDPCGSCASCVQLRAGTHPDLLTVSKPHDKNALPVELFIGPRERRMQEGLCHDIRLRPFMGGRRVAIIDDADYLNEESANALLKTLEEPPPKSVLILVGTSASRQLPTIRSRSQLVRFKPLPVEIVADLLVKFNHTPDREQAVRIAANSQGSLERAIELVDADWWAFRRELLARLCEPDLDSAQFARMCLAFIDTGGKEASARRRLARQLLSLVADFYAQLTRVLCGAAVCGDDELPSALAKAASCTRLGVDQAAASCQRSLEAIEQIERYAHQVTVIECWLDDLARIAAGELWLEAS